MILIYSKDVDDFVNDVIDWLKVDFIRIGESNKVDIQSMIFSNIESTYSLKNEFTEFVDLDKVQIIWFNGGCINSGSDDYENKCYEILNDSFLLQKRIKKIGKRYTAIEINRLDVMLEAKINGLRIPHTLITGSKSYLKKFFDLHKSKNGIISKRILDSYFYEDDDYLYNFNLTFEISQQIYEKIPDEFSISFFQERIIADFEIRVIFIDGLFYATSIHTFDNKIDYRTKLIEMNNIRMVPFQLPLKIQRKLKNIFRKFNMNYGSADLMYSNGEYIFLEINPTGQISFINNSCNYYIEKKVSEILNYGK